MIDCQSLLVQLRNYLAFLTQMLWLVFVGISLSLNQINIMNYNMVLNSTFLNHIPVINNSTMSISFTLLFE